MKIFLAGATGAIGRLLLPLLIEAGHEVTGTTRSADKFAQISRAGGRPVALDVFDRAATFAALQAAQPEVVIHQLTDLIDLDFANNTRLRIEGSRNLVDAAKAVEVGRMIAQSISWMYGPGSMPAGEDEPLDVDAPAPRNRSVAAVQSLEQAVLEIPVGIVLRYGILYGPATWYFRDGLTTEEIRRGEIEANDAVTSFVHVGDAAQAAFQALSWPTGVLNIVDDAPAKASEWVPVYAGLVGAEPPPIKTGAQAWERGASNAKARQLDWRPQYPDWLAGFKVALAA